MSDHNIPEAQCYDCSPEAEDNRKNIVTLEKQAKQSTGIRNLLLKMKRKFSQKSSSYSNNQFSTNSSSEGSSSASSAQPHFVNALPNLDDDEKKCTEKMRIGTSSLSLSANAEQDQCSSLDSIEDFNLELDTFFSELSDTMMNFTVTDQRDFVDKKDDTLESIDNETLSKCPTMNVKRSFDNDSLATTMDSAMLCGHVEPMLESPNCDDKKDDASSKPLSGNVKYCVDTEILGENEQEENEITSQYVTNRPESDLNHYVQECNTSVGCSQRKNLLPNLATAGETIVKLIVTEDMCPTYMVDEQSQPDRVLPNLDTHPGDTAIIDSAEMEHVGANSLRMGAYQGSGGNAKIGKSHHTGKLLININDRSESDQDDISSVDYFRIQEQLDIDSRNKVMGADQEPTQDDAVMSEAQSCGASCSGLKLDTNMTMIHPDFLELERAAHEDRKFFDRIGDNRTTANYSEPVMSVEAEMSFDQHLSGSDVMNGSVLSSLNDGGPKVAGRTRSNPQSEMKSSAEVMIHEYCVKSDTKPIQDLVQSSIDDIISPLANHEYGIKENTLSDGQYSTFAVKGGVIYTDNQECDTKCAIPNSLRSGLHVSLHEAKPNSSVKSIQSPAPIPYAEDFTSSASKTRESWQNGDNLSELSSCSDQSVVRQGGRGARPKEKPSRPPNALPIPSKPLNDNDIKRGGKCMEPHNSAGEFDVVSPLSSNPATLAFITPSPMQPPIMPRLTCNENSSLVAETDTKEQWFTVGERKASHGTDDPHESDIGIYIGTNNGDELHSPMNDRFQWSIDRATNSTSVNEAFLDGSEQKQSHDEINTGTLFATQVTSHGPEINQLPLTPAPELTSNNRKRLGTDLRMETNANVLGHGFCFKEDPILPGDIEMPLSEPTQSAESEDSYSVVQREHHGTSPQSTFDDNEVIVNAECLLLDKSVIQQDEPIDEMNSASGVSSIQSNSILNYGTKCTMLTSSQIPSVDNLPSASCNLTPNATHEEFCEPDHRSKRKSIIPSDSERYFMSQPENFTSEHSEAPQSTQDRNQLRCGLLELSGSLIAPFTELRQRFSDVDVEPVNVDVIETFQTRCTDEPGSMIMKQPR